MDTMTAATVSSSIVAAIALAATVYFSRRTLKVAQQTAEESRLTSLATLSNSQATQAAEAMLTAESLLRSLQITTDYYTFSVEVTDGGGRRLKGDQGISWAGGSEDTPLRTLDLASNQLRIARARVRSLMRTLELTSGTHQHEGIVRLLSDMVEFCERAAEGSRNSSVSPKELSLVAVTNGSLEDAARSLDPLILNSLDNVPRLGDEGRASTAFQRRMMKLLADELTSAAENTIASGA